MRRSTISSATGNPRAEALTNLGPLTRRTSTSHRSEVGGRSGWPTRIVHPVRDREGSPDEDVPRSLCLKRCYGIPFILPRRKVAAVGKVRVHGLGPNCQTGSNQSIHIHTELS